MGRPGKLAPWTGSVWQIFVPGQRQGHVDLLVVGTVPHNLDLAMVRHSR